METSEIEAIIQQALPDAEIDVSGEECSFTLAIISDTFEGQNLMQRQKLVLALFQTQLKTGRLHALTIKAYTPAQFAELQNTHLVQLEC
ncbi:BolA family protein [Marinobacterium lutimaris]|uniref:Acid stress-induced BolA-like protein IbaG/YrbA, predicted regulator of iron metabolism n=1 Tax=Marinobacterium lutimaris TaxID=568106 RepID=A0A1H5YRI9_9GAMM|nr:BolA/IbaG family iron-sulfur metabolism protein [Marinobacterium lutimaris]SEG26723.1 Acid stress-induced BolA-like protein IbaG/YrbA, predicted regulator of iron metabolism [Marinobacterium lutimaris]